MDLNAAVDVVRGYLSEVRVPATHDKVYKDECMFTFDTPESTDGIYLNLSTFQAFGKQYVDVDRARTSQHVYLHQQWTRVPLTPEEEAARLEKPTQLAVGGDAGFQVDSKPYSLDKAQAIVVFPEGLRIPLPCPQLPELMLQALTAIAAHDSASRQEAVAVWQEERRVSRYAVGLQQLDTGRVIPSDPNQWRCDETGVTENLWLNLSTGVIGSGRQHWDGTGGNGSALRHYQATGCQYPLVVKLGTITPNGADVYSYADEEDDMVEDPLLAQHLAHWGINMMGMQKTEKSMAELQIDLNVAFEFDKITEAGAALRPLSGAGYTGLVNLGNSCYMNSVLQLLWTLPALQARYVWAADDIFQSAPAQPADDLLVQMAKVGVALSQGRTGQPTPAINEAVNAVRPQFFKSLVGRGHAEFSTNHQQDAVEYLQHLIELLHRAEHAASSTGRMQGQYTSNLFRFMVEDRIQCDRSGCVTYRRAPTNVLGLPIPLDAAVNKEQVEQYKEREAKRIQLAESNAAAYISAGEAATNGMSNVVEAKEKEAPVIPKVPLAACLAQWAQDEPMTDYHSAALQSRGPATKRQRCASLPPYLLVQMRRYYVADDWTARKMEVAVDVPDRLSLEDLRGRGLQAGETPQPEADVPANVAPVVDDAIVAAIVGMGFSQHGAMRAALAVGNASVEAATEWVFAHMEDADFDQPLPATGPAAGPPTTVQAQADPEQVAMLSAMGFSDAHAQGALAACGGNVERAADWLFNHADDLDAAVAAAAGGGAPSGGAAEGEVDDGRGDYELVGFVSHMGTNTACGHYVAHIKKEGRWAIFNDDKVAESAQPPRELGYLYMFKRVDTGEADAEMRDGP